MTLDNAIKRYKFWSEDDRIEDIIRSEHKQIAEWLTELKERRKYDNDDLIRRSDAIKAFKKDYKQFWGTEVIIAKLQLIPVVEPKTDSEIPKNALRSTCTGCRFVGSYDTEFPCVNCSRRIKDYYAKDELQTDCQWK